MNISHRIAIVLSMFVSVLAWSACGAPDSEESVESDRIGEVEQAVGVGQACGLAATKPKCDQMLTCCDYVNGWGTCFDTMSDETHCALPGACGVVCPAGQACGGGVCGPPCTYHRDCASGLICVGGFLGTDQVGYSVGGMGSCQAKTCTTTPDCDPAYEPTGVIAGWGAITPDNDLKCFSGHCYASASDPHHCGPNNNDICAVGPGKCGAGATCMTNNNNPVGCEGTCGACPHAKSVPGYWRTCP